MVGYIFGGDDTYMTLHATSGTEYKIAGRSTDENAIISWGDGVVEALGTSFFTLTHQYDSDGDYTIYIKAADSKVTLNQTTNLARYLKGTLYIGGGLSDATLLVEQNPLRIVQGAGVSELIFSDLYLGRVDISGGFTTSQSPLERLVISANVSSIETRNEFNLLKTTILKSLTVPTFTDIEQFVGNALFADTSGMFPPKLDSYIYVPQPSLSDYKAAFKEAYEFWDIYNTRSIDEVILPIS